MNTVEGISSLNVVFSDFREGAAGDGGAGPATRTGLLKNVINEITVSGLLKNILKVIRGGRTVNSVVNVIIEVSDLSVKNIIITRRRVTERGVIFDYTIGFGTRTYTLENIKKKNIKTDYCFHSYPSDSTLFYSVSGCGFYNRSIRERNRIIYCK